MGTNNNTELELVACRDALDHIARTCQKSRSQTRRIMWIEALATGALEGNDQWKSINLPKNGQPTRRHYEYEIECLKEINEELLDALKAMRSACFDRRKANDEFERLGELYYHECGRLRPGKDDPARDSMSEENVKQYDEWSRKRIEAAFDLADAAIAKATGA